MTTANANRQAGLFILLLLFILAFLLLSFAPTSSASQTEAPLWQDISETDAMRQSNRRLVPSAYRLLRLNTAVLQDNLRQAPAEFSGERGLELTLPLPDGTNARFLIHNSPIMEPELAAKFPEIQTYNGRGLDDPTATVRLGWTQHGFHATIRAVGQPSIYIDPYAWGDTVNYISYRVSDYNTAPANFVRSADQVDIDPVMLAKIESLVATGQARLTGDELRIYRLAVAATGEYTQFHGGTVVDGLTAVVTAMNRVNGLYERDVAIRMVLVGNNDQIIYTNAATDPYTNNDGVTMLSQNQTNLDNVIGNVNYDVGHVFSTGGGGVASLGVPCVTGAKARGVTGLTAPIGDPFYVDYVAHELGHQWGATHTFNGNAGSCAGGNRTGSTAYEPGSGTTIMAYAGICGAQNIQSNSDDHFHGASYDQIVAYSTLGGGNSCAQVQATGNTPPVADAGDDYTIPADTPFVLTGSGTDANGDDVLSYNWEQFDLGPAATLNNPDLPPHFRSFPSKNEPERTFPQISDILNNTSTLGEMLPGATDTLTFRLTVRDNRPNGGGADFDTLNLNVINTAGPFVVTEPTQAATWTATTTAAVNWDVAGTDSAPVNCSQVDIALSTDGGNAFDQILATAVPNDGSELVNVPNVTTTQARVRVMCSDNVFFNISGASNFEIVNPSDPTFTLNADPASQNVCVPANGVIAIDTQAVLGFSETINLTAAGEPSGTTAVFGQTSLTPGQATTLTISDTDNAPTGDYTLTITGTATTVTRVATAQLTLLPGSLSAPTLAQPLDGATNVGFLPTFNWQAVTNAANYEFELATDDAFTNIVYSTITGDLEATPPAELASATVYYWRVTAVGVCGESASATYSFTTQLAPGACGPGQTEQIVFSDDFEAGAGDWTHSGVQDSWALSGANPFSGNFSWFAVDQSSTSDQRLVSPAIEVPVGENVTLQFQNRQFFEAPDAQGCWDAGILEISTDDGASWDYVPNNFLLPDADPYDQLLWNEDPGNNPISNDYGQVQAWCDPSQDYRNAVVDLSDYEGQTVRFRWRLGTDGFVGAEGWYIDDVKVQACTAGLVPSYGVVSEAASSGTAAVGTTITHTINLTNTGNMTDTYDLTIGGESWPTAVSSTSIELLPDQMDSVDVVVTVPSEAAGQLDNATLTITSQGDNAVSRVTQLSTSAYDPAGLRLSAPLSATTAVAGEMVTYTVVLSNHTGLSDIVALTVGGTATGTIAPSTHALVSGASVTATVTITVPAEALAGQVYTHTVTAVPADERLLPQALSLSTQIYDADGLLLSAPVISATAVAGTSVTYTVNITNHTGLTDTFHLTVTGTAVGSALPLTVTLGNGQSITASVRVTVPLSAPLATTYTNTLAVTPTNSLIAPQSLALFTNTPSHYDLFLPIVIQAQP